MTRGLQVVVVGCSAALLLAADAGASTIAVVGSGKGEALVYTAGPGEQNRLKAESAAGVVTVKDPGADVTAGNECVQVTAHEATCDRNNPFPTQLLRAELAGGDDRADARAGVAWDGLEGGGGDDELEGGDGLDRMNGEAGADRIDGAGAQDFVSYLGRSDDVRVTLGDGKANDGGSLDGSGDRVLRVESVAGGDGDDALFGTKGENTLVGGNGGDLLEAGGGDDDVFAGEGADTLRGQGGDDGLQLQDGADRAFGGAGADIMIFNGDDRPDLIVGGGDPGDKTQMSLGGPYRISLDGKPNDGQCDAVPCTTSSEGDDVRGILILDGSFSPDLLIGSKKADTIRPSLGADRVSARGGNDTITLNPGDGADEINCGRGTDTVNGEQGEDTLAPNCEL